VDAVIGRVLADARRPDVEQRQVLGLVDASVGVLRGVGLRPLEVGARTEPLGADVQKPQAGAQRSSAGRGRSDPLSLSLSLSLPAPPPPPPGAALGSVTTRPDLSAPRQTG